MADELEQLKKENADLRKKLNVLERKQKEFERRGRNFEGVECRSKPPQLAQLELFCREMALLKTGNGRAFRHVDLPIYGELETVRLIAALTSACEMYLRHQSVKSSYNQPATARLSG